MHLRLLHIKEQLIVSSQIPRIRIRQIEPYPGSCGKAQLRTRSQHSVFDTVKGDPHPGGDRSPLTNYLVTVLRVQISGNKFTP